MAYVFIAIILFVVFYALISFGESSKEKAADIESANKTIEPERKRAYVFGLDKYRAHVFDESDYINNIMYATSVLQNTHLEKEGSLTAAGAIGYGLAGLGGGIAATQGMAEENEKIRQRNAENIAFSTKQANDIMKLSESLYNDRHEAKKYNDSLSKEYDIILSDPDELFKKYELEKEEERMNERSNLFIGEYGCNLTIFHSTRPMSRGILNLSGSLLAKIYDANDKLCGCAYLDLDGSYRVPSWSGRKINAHAKNISKSNPYHVKLEPFILWEVALKRDITDAEGNRWKKYKDTATKDLIFTKALQKEREINDALSIPEKEKFIPWVN